MIKIQWILIAVLIVLLLFNPFGGPGKIDKKLDSRLKKTDNALQVKKVEKAMLSTENLATFKLKERIVYKYIKSKPKTEYILIPRENWSKNYNPRTLLLDFQTYVNLSRKSEGEHKKKDILNNEIIGLWETKYDLVFKKYNGLLKKRSRKYFLIVGLQVQVLSFSEIQKVRFGIGFAFGKKILSF